MLGNAVPDIPRVYTAIAEWLSCGVIVNMIGIRQKRGLYALYSLLYLAAIIVFMEATATVTLWLWLPCMIVAFLSMVVFIRICNQTNLCESVYYAVIAFSVAEFMASLEWQIVNSLYPTNADMPIWAELLILLVVYGGVLLFLWKMYRMQIEKGFRLIIEKKDYIISLLICAVIFGFSNLGFAKMSSSNPGQYNYDIGYIRTLVDLAGVVAIYAHLLSCHNNMTKKELIALKTAFQNQYIQYTKSKDSVELINIKYHDLKHQIGILRGINDSDQIKSFLDRMEEGIKFYELQNKTGNSVLDTLLTSKSIYCNKHDITMTVVADGSLIDFIDIMDICSIFGNALDNAIEAVEKIEDKQKRLIHVTISRVKSFVMIRVQNYYEGNLIKNGDDLASTKQDPEGHGYGLKSIRYSVDRYNGVVKTESQNNWFEIKILIPIVE